jgi:hypothetical protein
VIVDEFALVRESAVKRRPPHTPMEVQMRVQPTISILSKY